MRTGRVYLLGVVALATLEYGESPAALCARTRYLYVVCDANPLSV
jgi:hypothetical protein